MQLLLNLLWSLNERDGQAVRLLMAIAARLGAEWTEPLAGADLPPPSLQWLADVAAVDQEHARQIRQARKRSKKKSRRQAQEAERQAAFERGYT